jgi:hypothetical protein
MSVWQFLCPIFSYTAFGKWLPKLKDENYFHNRTAISFRRSLFNKSVYVTPVIVPAYWWGPRIRICKYYMRAFSRLVGSDIPVVARSKAGVCRRPLAGIAGSNPKRAGMSVSCEYWVLSEVSVSGWSLVQSSPTECGVSECDREASIMRGPCPTRDCCAIERSLFRICCILLFNILEIKTTGLRI